MVETERLLDMAGLRTAGWITAQWLHLLTGNTVAAELSDRLRPGPGAMLVVAQLAAP